MAPFYSELYLKFPSLESKKKIVGYKKGSVTQPFTTAMFFDWGFFSHLGLRACRYVQNQFEESCRDPSSLVLRFIQMPRSFLQFDFYAFYISVSLTKMWFLTVYAGSHADINVDLWDSHGSNCFSDILTVTWIAWMSNTGTFFESTLRIVFFRCSWTFFPL